MFNSEIKPNTVLQTTHDLIKIELIMFLSDHKRESMRPDEIDKFIKVLYSRLNLKLEE